jgi:putative ABC transport system ATP-binding protein
MAKPIVVGKGVKKVYVAGRLKVEALRGIDISIMKGEMVAVTGPSGCGKTTLLNCLSGLDDVTGGRVFVEGKDLLRMGDRERSRYRAERMGFVFQAYNLLPVLTAAENVELPLLVTGTDLKGARERALDALDKVKLKDRADHKPSELSGGEQQRVAIARALVNEPAIIWADEPTGNLDSETSNDIVSLMSEINKSDSATFVIVTHDTGVSKRAHRVIDMRDGRLVGQGEGGS